MEIVGFDGVMAEKDCRLYSIYVHFMIIQLECDQTPSFLSYDRDPIVPAILYTVLHQGTSVDTIASSPSNQLDTFL